MLCIIYRKIALLDLFLLCTVILNRVMLKHRQLLIRSFDLHLFEFHQGIAKNGFD